MGCILVLLVKINSSSSVIPAIRMVRDGVSSHMSEITGTFKEYYENLDKSHWVDGEGQMGNFFRRLEVPVLSGRERKPGVPYNFRRTAAGSGQDG